MGEPGMDMDMTGVRVSLGMQFFLALTLFFFLLCINLLIKKNIFSFNWSLQSSLFSLPTLSLEILQ